MLHRASQDKDSALNSKVGCSDHVRTMLRCKRIFAATVGADRVDPSDGLPVL